MSRAKRTRKARSAAKRERRLKMWYKSAHAVLADTKERSELRKQIMSIDGPDAVKMVFAALVDPVGFLHERMSR